MAELSEAFEVAKVGFSRNIFIETTKNHSCILVSSKENGFMKFTVSNAFGFCSKKTDIVCRTNLSYFHVRLPDKI